MQRVQTIAKPKVDEQKTRGIVEWLLADAGGAMDVVPHISPQSRAAPKSAAEISFETLCSAHHTVPRSKSVRWSKHHGACTLSLCVDAEDVRQVSRCLIRTQRSYFANGLAKLFIWLQRRSALMF